MDTRSEISQNKFELYFRVYLLVKYYYEVFHEINNQIRLKYDQTKKYIMYRFKPDSSEPEGRLFQILDFLKPNLTPATGREYMNMEDLKEFTKVVDKISIKHKLVSNDQVYSKII